MLANMLYSNYPIAAVRVKFGAGAAGFVAVLLVRLQDVDLTAVFLIRIAQGFTKNLVFGYNEPDQYNDYSVKDDIWFVIPSPRL